MACIIPTTSIAPCLWTSSRTTPLPPPGARWLWPPAQRWATITAWPSCPSPRTRRAPSPGCGRPRTRWRSSSLRPRRPSSTGPSGSLAACCPWRCSRSSGGRSIVVVRCWWPTWRVSGGGYGCCRCRSRVVFCCGVVVGTEEMMVSLVLMVMTAVDEEMTTVMEEVMVVVAVVELEVMN